MKKDYLQPNLELLETTGFVITDSGDVFSSSDNDGSWMEKWNEIFG